jgi:hypothetical protein
MALATSASSTFPGRTWRVGGHVNRIKLRLTDLDWPLIEQAIARAVPLEADASGREAGGGTVPVA